MNTLLNSCSTQYIATLCSQDRNYRTLLHSVYDDQEKGFQVHLQRSLAFTLDYYVESLTEKKIKYFYFS